jgi:hypothetical protein
MTTLENISIRPVDKNNWEDFETLFESKGAPGYCWCMAWRMTKEERKNNTSENRKKFIQHRVFNNSPIGLLAFLNDEPIAWCSVAPRASYRSLGGDESLEKVWSIACFYIKRIYRGKGLVGILIESAKNYAKENEARFVEAYPVDPDSPSYRFMGFVKSFEKAGFAFVKNAGNRRHVMVCRLE